MIFPVPLDAAHLRMQSARVAWDYLRRTLFVLPSNDGEAVRAGQILQALPAPHLHISRQRWGAVLEKEMSAVLAKLSPVLTTVCIVEIPGREVDVAGRLRGEEELRARGLRVDVIDHHFYHWIDRSHPYSALEQLCTKINWQLDDFDLQVAINDRAWIPGLLAHGLDVAQIRMVRNFDLRAQGHREEKIAAHTAAAQRLVASGQLQAQDGVYVLEKIPCNAAVLAQELALQQRDGLVNIFEGRARKFSFSGCPAVVDILRDTDYAALGYPRPYLIYGGGDVRFSRFFGLQSTATIVPMCHMRVLAMIRRCLRAKKIKK